MASFTTLMKAAQWAGASPALRRSSLLHMPRPLAPLCHGYSPSHNLFGRIPSGLSDNGEEAFSKPAALSWGPECVAAHSVCVFLSLKSHKCAAANLVSLQEQRGLDFITSVCSPSVYAVPMQQQYRQITWLFQPLTESSDQRNHHLHYHLHYLFFFKFWSWKRNKISTLFCITCFKPVGVS